MDSLKTLFIPFGGLLKWQFDREASQKETALNGAPQVDGEGWKCFRNVPGWDLFFLLANVDYNCNNNSV